MGSSSPHDTSVEAVTASTQAQPVSNSKNKGHGRSTAKKTKKAPLSSSSSSSSSLPSTHPPAKTSKSKIITKTTLAADTTTTRATTFAPQFRNPFETPLDSPLTPHNNHHGNLFAVDGVAGASDYSNTTTPPTPLSLVSHEADNRLLADHPLEQYNDYHTHQTNPSSSRFTSRNEHGSAAKNTGSTKRHRHNHHHHHNHDDFDEAPQDLNQQLPSSPPPAKAAVAAARTASSTTQRQRNRLAATKCRAKSRAAVAELEATERGMRFQHMELSDTATKLKNEVLALKNEVLRHGNCDCDHIKEYLTNAARVIGGSMLAASNAQHSQSAGLGDGFTSTSSVATAGSLARHDSACSGDFKREYH
jgi:hypothetical protein